MTEVSLQVINTEVMTATRMTLGEFSEKHSQPISETADPDYKGYRLQHKSIIFPGTYITWVSRYDFNKRFKVVT